MIYLDTSVALAALFAEPRRPPARFWRNTLIASRLIEYEVMVRINACVIGGAAIGAARNLLDGMMIIELDPTVLARAQVPFPQPVRTLDALHLATMDYLRGQGQHLELASYDQRLSVAAQALGFPLARV